MRDRGRYIARKVLTRLEMCGVAKSWDLYHQRTKDAVPVVRFVEHQLLIRAVHQKTSNKMQLNRIIQRSIAVFFLAYGSKGRVGEQVLEWV